MIEWQQLRASLTDNVKGKPVPDLSGVYSYHAARPERIKLLQKEVHVLVNNVLLVPKGTGAESMRKGPPLLGVDYWITDPDDAWLIGLVPFVLEEPLLAVRHVPVDITI